MRRVVLSPNLCDRIKCVRKTPSAGHSRRECCRLERDSLLETTVAELLLLLGVPVQLAGFGYLCEAIILTCTEDCGTNGLTRKIYPSAAAKFGVAPSLLEREIRRSIFAAWDRAFPAFSGMFPNARSRTVTGAPTNSEFIAAVSSRMLEAFLRE